MAKAKIEYKNISIKLDLSLEEAFVLRSIVNRVGGDHSTARIFCEEINDCLSKLNIGNIDSKFVDISRNSIYFAKGSLEEVQKMCDKYIIK